MALESIPKLVIVNVFPKVSILEGNQAVILQLDNNFKVLDG